MSSIDLHKVIGCTHTCLWDVQQIMTFKPDISKRAHELPSRSVEELSEGDRLRRDCYLVCPVPNVLHTYTLNIIQANDVQSGNYCANCHSPEHAPLWLLGADHKSLLSTYPHCGQTCHAVQDRSQSCDEMQTSP